jgi:mannose/fructose/N-acetylgalactosamine-specific phosphotransferase system component IIC
VVGHVKRLFRSGIVHVLFAFLALGSWAAFANRLHPMPAPLVAGLLQGGLSASITLFLKRGIDFLATRLDGAAALIVPPIAAASISASLLTTIHGLSRTPEILATVALPLAVATTYARCTPAFSG